MNKETTKIYGDFYVTASEDPAIYGTGNMKIDGDLDVLGDLNLTLSHSSLTNLLNDDHTQYLLLAGRNTGQTIIGGTGASDNLTITSTSNATKGSVIFSETTASTSSTTGSVRLAGSIAISNTTDASSSTNGGTFTSAGGLAVAKKGYFGGLLTAENGLTSTAGTTTLGASTIGAITGTSATFSSTLGVTGLATFSGGLTSTAGTTTLGASTIGAITGTSATFSSTLGVTGVVTLNNLTASQAVFTDASKNLVSVATTGTGNVVLATSPTLVTPVLGDASVTSLNISGLASSQAVFTDASKNLVSVATTGTGNAVLQTSPTLITPILGIAEATTLTLTGTTDATSSTVGGTFTNAGGAAIAKKLFVGTDTSLATVSGITTIGSTTALTVSASGVLTVNNTTTSTSSSTGSVLLAGGIGISNTTDATDVTNGGTFTTAGGASIGKQLFVGTRLSINGTQPTLDGGLRSRLFMTGPTTDSGTGPHIMATVDSSIYPIFHQLNYARDIVSLNFDMYYSGGSYRLSDTAVTGFQMTKINNTLQFNYTTSGTTGNPVTLAGGLAINNVGIVTVSCSLASTSNSTGSLLVGGGIAIFNNTTDASSTTNGGTFTTGGGAAIAKKLYVGSSIYLDGENSAFTVDVSTPRRLGIVKKTGGGPFFAIGSAASFEFRVANSTTVDDVAATTYTNLATLSNSGLFTLTGTTDATSSTSGGTFTNSGGAAIAKKLFVGTDTNLATVSGITTIGSSTPVTISAAGVMTIANNTTSTSTTTGALIVTGGVGISGALYAASGNFTTLSAPHSGLSGLLNDDHTQYTLLAGRSGGQILTGGTASGNSLTLRSTSNATKGSVLLDETTATTSASTGSLQIAGGIGISNTTDSTSITNGGTFTTAGGAAIAKILHVGNNVYIGGTQPVIGGGSISRLFLTGTAGSTTSGPHIMATVSTDNFPVFHQTNFGHNNISLNFDIYYDDTYRRAHTSPGYQIFKFSDVLSFRYASAGTAGTIPSIGEGFSLNSSGVINIPGTTASTSNTTGILTLAGGIAISNATDATSSTNGGTITTAGGIAVAKKAFIGTDISVGGTTLLSNYFQTVNITAPSNPPASNIRFYTDSADSLLKSKDSAGTVTVYQPTTTKGDLVSHNGTTQTRVPVGLDNTYLIADSTQSSGLRWGNLTNVYYVYEQLPQGTNGGTATSGSWLQRVLNTIDEYPAGTSKVTLSGSNMIFEPGVYKIIAYTGFSITNASVAARLFNVTSSTVLLKSLTHRCTNNNAQVYYAYVYGIITITVTSTVRLEYFTTITRLNDGLGRASGIQAEGYSHLEIQLIEYNP